MGKRGRPKTRWTDKVARDAAKPRVTSFLQLEEHYEEERGQWKDIIRKAIGHKDL